MKNWFPGSSPKVGWNAWTLKICHEQNGVFSSLFLGDQLLQNNQSL